MSEHQSEMRDPHVVYLRYGVECDREIDFRADPAAVETDDFAIRIAYDGLGVPGIVARTSARPANASDDAILTVPLETEAVVTMKRHFASVAEAQAAVEPYLRSWEIQAALSGAPRFRFVEIGDLVIDRDPPPGEEAQYAVSGSGSFKVVNPERSTRIASYPLPSAGFALDEHARTVWDRWQRYLDGSEALTAVAYSVLTYLENRFAIGRADAARRLRVSRNVLDRLAVLASSVGDDKTTRKFAPPPRGRPHTAKEVEWVEALIPELIRRLGRLAVGEDATSFAELTVRDLPGSSGSPAADQ